MMQLALFACHLEPRHFWLWDWMKETHDWIVTREWKEPLHYGTAFHTEKQCVKCLDKRIEVYEAYGS